MSVGVTVARATFAVVVDIFQMGVEFETRSKSCSGERD